MPPADVCSSLLEPNPHRYTLFPIQHDGLWDMCKKAVASFWTAEEIDLTTDIDHWKRLTDDERHFVSHVLAFFASADGIVSENLATRFMKDVQLPEARYFYGQQMAIEMIHGEVYSLLIDTLVRSPAERMRLFRGLDTIPCIARKGQWALRWIENKEASFGERLVAFAVVEGVFFSGAFCSIFWLKKRGLMPGLSFSNELISRDEGMHCDFACMLFQMLAPAERPSDARVREIVAEAVAIEHDFVEHALPVQLIGMSAPEMKTYICFIANRLLRELGVPELYPGAANPFDFMDMICLQGKTNFFERRNSEYQKGAAALRRGGGATAVFTTDADF